MLIDIEIELEDSCDCFERALDICREFFPQDKELYDIILAGREHARWIASLITNREPGVIAECEKKE
jgi:hypothetical protein